MAVSGGPLAAYSSVVVVVVVGTADTTTVVDGVTKASIDVMAHPAKTKTQRVTISFIIMYVCLLSSALRDRRL